MIVGLLFDTLERHEESFIGSHDGHQMFLLEIP